MLILPPWTHRLGLAVQTAEVIGTFTAPALSAAVQQVLPPSIRIRGRWDECHPPNRPRGKDPADRYLPTLADGYLPQRYAGSPPCELVPASGRCAGCLSPRWPHR